MNALDPSIAGRLKHDADGLVAAVVQDVATRDVLMVGWMDDEALRRTLTEKRATFWSRSRQRYWTKGEESGNFLDVTEVRLDCDGDTILVLANPAGPTCHTGTRTCFDGDQLGAPPAATMPKGSGGL